MKPKYQSDQQIADSYGVPFIFDEEMEYVSEESAVSVKRIVGMHNTVTKWIEKNRRIPSASPNADREERKMANWLRVVMFYKEVMLDPKDEHRDERLHNSFIHEYCQTIIRTGTVPEQEYNSNMEEDQ
jgi:hypothetical protein